MLPAQKEGSWPRNVRGELNAVQERLETHRMPRPPLIPVSAAAAVACTGGGRGAEQGVVSCGQLAVANTLRKSKG